MHHCRGWSQGRLRRSARPAAFPSICQPAHMRSPGLLYPLCLCPAPPAPCSPEPAAGFAWVYGHPAQPNTQDFSARGAAGRWPPAGSCPDRLLFGYPFAGAFISPWAASLPFPAGCLSLQGTACGLRLCHEIQSQAAAGTRGRMKAARFVVPPGQQGVLGGAGGVRLVVSRAQGSFWPGSGCVCVRFVHLARTRGCSRKVWQAAAPGSPGATDVAFCSLGFLRCWQEGLEAGRWG